MIIPLSKILFDTQEEKEVIKTLRSGWIMQGTKVTELEEKISSYLNIPYAVAVSSGTAALHLALLGLGIGVGDEVIVPSLSFIATANCVLYVGAKPIFADVEENTYNIDPEDIEKKITKKTKAIIVAHQVGLAANMDAIIKLAKKYKLLIVEDAACALGATYNNKLVGTFGDIACFSFHPRKSITTAEGGMIVTKNKKMAEYMRSIRSHGIINGSFQNLGYNFRLSDVHASIGLAQFKKLNLILKNRKKLVDKYNFAFKKSTMIIPPFVPENCVHTYQSYVIMINKNKMFRDDLVKKLKTKGISSNPSIMIAHKEPFYKNLFGTISLPKSEKINDLGIILPLYPQMTSKEQQYVIQTVLDFIS